jgi:uncharacterized membrane protein
LSVRGLPALRTDRGGSISVMATLTLTIVMGLLALVTDSVLLHLHTRRAQGATDVAAMIAAENLPRAAAAATAVLGSNGFGAAPRVTVDVGRYEADPARPVDARFVAGGLAGNAAHVALSSRPPLVFAPLLFGLGDFRVETEAVGVSRSNAALAIGSRLASLNGGLLNQLLGAMLGGSVNLTLVDYNALAGANVEIDALLTAIALRAGSGDGTTYNDVLDSEVSVATLIAAAASITNQPAAAQVLTRLGGVGGSTTLPLASLVDLGALGRAEVGSALSPTVAVSLLDLLRSSATIANGDHAVALDLTTGVPGLAQLRTTITIGEGLQTTSWVTVGESGAELTTAQIRVKLEAVVGGSGLLAGISVRVPVTIEVASGRAILRTVECDYGAGGGNRFSVDAAPGLLSLMLGDGAGPVTVVSAPLVTATASAHVTAANLQPTRLTFSQSDIRARATQTVGTTSILAPALRSLLSTADIQVVVGGIIPLPVPLLKTQLGAILGTLAAPLDGVLIGLLDTLGIGVGELDVTALGLGCGGAALVR